MSALGHIRTHAPQQSVGLFDHLVGAAKQRKRHRDAERLCCRRINKQLKLGGLLNGEIAGLVTLEDSSGVCSDESIIFAFIASETDESTRRHERTILLDDRDPILKRELGNLLGWTYRSRRPASAL